MECKKFKVIQLRKDNPSFTLELIANIVGLTRERVRQILQTSDMPTRSVKPVKPVKPVKTLKIPRHFGRPRINRGYKMIRVDIDTHNRLKKIAGKAKLAEYLRHFSLSNEGE